jgi:hypothetical protein
MRKQKYVLWWFNWKHLRKLVVTKVIKKWLSRLYEINRKTWGQNKIPDFLTTEILWFIN